MEERKHNTPDYSRFEHQSADITRRKGRVIRWKFDATQTITTHNEIAGTHFIAAVTGPGATLAVWLTRTDRHYGCCQCNNNCEEGEMHCLCEIVWTAEVLETLRCWRTVGDELLLYCREMRLVFWPGFCLAEWFMRNISLGYFVRNWASDWLLPTASRTFTRRMSQLYFRVGPTLI